MMYRNTDDYFSSQNRVEAFIVFNHENDDDITIFGCDSVGTDTELCYGKNGRLHCDCNRKFSTTQMPEYFQKKFMDCLDKQTVEDYENKKRELELEISDIKKQVDYDRSRMKSTYEMLEEFMNWADKVERVSPKLFDAWIDMKHMISERGINFCN